MTKIPPHNLDAERGLLGCCLLSPKECLPECVSRFNGVEVFYDLRNQKLFDLMCEMNDQGKPVDVSTVWPAMDAELREQVGIDYLGTLPDSTPNSANVDYFAEIVLEKRLLRDMAQACESSAHAIYQSNGESSAELLDEAEKKVLKVRSGMVKKQGKTMKELVRGAIDRFEKLFQKQDKLPGISTGFPDLDEVTKGLHAPQLTILGGSPSSGKTSLAMNIAEHSALDLGLPVGVFSLEMSADELVDRMLLSRSRLNGKTVHLWTNGNFQTMTLVSVKAAKAAVFIDDSTDMTISQGRARARVMASQHGIKLFVLDHLQLMNGSSGKKSETRNDELGAVSRGLKATAKELHVPVIALSQLTKVGNETRLRSSGEITADADNIWLLDTRDDENSTNSCPSTLWIKKQRNGPRNVPVHFTFMKCYTRFESTTKTQP